MAKERVNIYTIAREAGVSAATVSRVMTNNAKVSREKRERVEAVIRKYGYAPNALAQGLSTAKTHTIGLMIADISSPFYTTLATACEKAANQSGYMLMILSSLGDYELEKRQLVKMYEQQVDAIVVIGGRIDHVSADEEYVELLNRLASTTPVIATGRLPGADTKQVCLDEERCMDLVMEHLIGLGHQRIAMIGGRRKAKSTFEKRMRYRAMLRENGIGGREEYILETEDYGNESGYARMKQLIRSGGELPTAVVAINDYTASGIIRALHEAGIRVPEDIAVTAFDDTYLSSAVTPPLTSAGCDYTEFGRILINTAIRASNEEEVPEKQVIPVHLTIRESTVSRKNGAYGSTA